MRRRGPGNRTVFVLAVTALLALPSLALAQGGIAVDAEGVLRTKAAGDQGGRLTKERLAAAKAALNPKVAKRSELRKISLNRLEREIIARQGVISDEMRCLAGLLRVRYIFYYPDTQDIVLAGPAEGWVADASGRVVGLSSGRPVLQLQDLVVALRAFPPGGQPTKLIGCSIDPTQEGLAALQRFCASIQNNPPAPNLVVSGVETSLGMHTVSVDGISPKTHFAQVLVEADYRMKLIGIGKEKPPVKMVSWVDRVTPTQLHRNAMQRWFFTPNYDCVRTSDDGLAMELVGDGVKLVGEDEMVTAEGERKAAGKADKASQAFVTSFTKAYSELADRSPVYAELRNLIDLVVGAAYLQKQDFYGKAGWKMEFFGDEKSLPVEVFNAPKQAPSAVNAIWRHRQLMTPIGGGVQIEPLMALDPEKRLPDENGRVDNLRQQTKVESNKGRWWWD